MRKLAILLAAFFALAVPAAASATTEYVDPSSIGGTCSDTYTAAQATSLSTPWCSLPQAIKAAPDGSTVQVRASNIPAFTDHWPLGYTHLQNRSSYVTFEPYPGESVTLNGMDLVGIDHETWQGFNLRGSYPAGGTDVKAVHLNGCDPYMTFQNDDVQVEGIEIDGRCSFTPGGMVKPPTGGYSSGGGHDVIANDTFHNESLNTAACSTVIDDSDAMAIQVFGADDFQILNNNINVGNDAINIGYATNVVVRGNTVQTVYQSAVQSPCTAHVDLIQTENHELGPITIDHNYFVQGGQFIIRDESGLTFEDNLVTNVQGYLQSVSNPGAKFIGNTFEDHGQHAATGGGDLVIEACNNAVQNCSTLFTDGYYTDISGTVVENNIFGKQWGVDTTSTSGGCCVTSSMFTEDYNIVNTTAPQNNTRNNPGTHDVLANGVPTFVTAPANQTQPSDYILAPGSVGFADGDGSVASPTDLLGTPRPSSNPDIGALQHGGAPVNSTPPTISGTAQQGSTLTESNGTWSPAATSYSYQWQDCDSNGANCQNISGATSQSYTLTSSDVGSTVRAVETASNASGSGQAPSAPSAVVLPLPPANSTAPSISGSAVVGQTLSLTQGGWSNNPSSVSDQWQDCDSAGANCTSIAGATGSSYAVQSSDVGHTIVVSETASNAGGQASASSQPTAVVSYPPNSATGGMTGVSNITSTGATFTGTYACAGDPSQTCNFFFKYKKNTDSTWTGKDVNHTETVQTSGALTDSVTGLASNTGYQVIECERYGLNIATCPGPQLSFTTSP